MAEITVTNKTGTDIVVSLEGDTLHFETGGQWLKAIHVDEIKNEKSDYRLFKNIEKWQLSKKNVRQIQDELLAQ